MTTTDRAAQLEQLVAAHRDAFAGLLAATGELDDAGWSTATGCPGWDVHDQLAHCTGLERRLLGDPDRDPEVVVPDLPHLTGDVGRFLERDVEARRGLPHTELHDEARETFDRRLTALRALVPDDLLTEVDGPLGRSRRSALLRMRLFDLACHERDVRGALGTLVGWDGAHLEVVAEHTVRTWSRTLPRAVEGGGHVRLEIAGAAPATIDLASGEVSRDADGTADLTLDLTLAEALALVSGRSDAPTPGQVASSGDLALRDRVLAAAGVTP